jgi:hypothetical protein
VQTPSRRRSGRTRAQVTPRLGLLHDKFRLSDSLRLVGGSHLSGTLEL